MEGKVLMPVFLKNQRKVEKKRKNWKGDSFWLVDFLEWCCYTGCRKKKRRRICRWVGIMLLKAEKECI